MIIKFLHYVNKCCMCTKDIPGCLVGPVITAHLWRSDDGLIKRGAIFLLLEMTLKENIQHQNGPASNVIR